MLGMRQPDCWPTSPELNTFHCHERQTNTRPTEDDQWARTNDQTGRAAMSHTGKLHKRSRGPGIIWLYYREEGVWAPRVRNQAEHIPVIPETYALDKSAGKNP